MSMFHALLADAGFPPGLYVSLLGSGSESGNGPLNSMSYADFQSYTLQASDTIYFKRGESYVFTELDVTVNNIAFGAYGSGADPKFYGSTSFSGATWTSETGGYYSTPLATAPLWVFKDGVEARQGESAFIRVVSKTNNTTLVATTAILQAYNAIEPLAGGGGSPAARISGKEFDFRWSYPSAIATYNGTNTITISPGNTGFGANTGFRLHGQKQFATLEGDWWYDDVNDKLWIKTASTPAGTDIRVCTERHAFFLDEATGTTISGIEFTQYFDCAIDAFRATNTTITDFYVHDIRQNGIRLYGNSTNYNITNGEVFRCGLNGIFVGAISASLFDSIEVHDIGMRGNYGWPYEGYWRKTGGTGFCIADDQNETVKLATTLTVSNCQFYNLGYQGCNVHGDDHVFDNVDIYDFCQRFMDGGGIHTFYRNDFGAGESTSNVIIQNSRIHDGIGSSEGLTNWRPPVVAGVYADAGTNNLEVRDCKLYDNHWFGFYANWNTEQSKLYDNFIANNGIGPAQVFYYEIPDVTNSPNFLRNQKNVLDGNLIICDNVFQFCVGTGSDGTGRDTSFNPYANGGSNNNNTYYAMAKANTSPSSPVAVNAVARHASSLTEFASVQPTTAYTNVSLATWQTRTSGDGASTASGFYLDQVGISGGVPQILIFDNATGSSVLEDFADGLYRNRAGTNVDDLTVAANSLDGVFIRPTYFYLMDNFLGSGGANISGRAPTIGNTPVVISGTHNIAAGDLMASSVAGQVLWNLGTDNYQFEMFAYIDNVVSTLVNYFRYLTSTSSNHRNILDFTGGNIRLREDSGSGLTTLATAAFTLAINTPYRIRVICNGTNIQVYVNGVQYINTTSAMSTGGFAGVLGETTRFTYWIAAYPI